MRALHVQVRRTALARVMQAARSYGANAPVAVAATRVEGEGERPDDEWSLVFANLPNENVGAFVDDIRRDVSDAQVTLLPVGALPLVTPLTQLDQSVSDVSRLSTLELVVGALQSIGAWRGMLMFSVLAGVIAAYGLIFDTGYILVAAMLVNPMGAPALVSVIGITIGDAHMFARGGLRFAMSLLIQALAAMLVGFGFGLTVSTRMLEQVTALSTWGVLIALAAGAAGAQALVKSERDSLVSGTAAGFMVAAALAPPAAVLGLSVPLGRWDYFSLMAFLLALQYLAIAVGGWIGLALFGVRPSEPSIGRGGARSRTALLISCILVTIGLVAAQVRLEPQFLKADLSRVALEIARDAVDRTPGALLVGSSARFTRREIEYYEGEALLMEIIVENGSAAEPDDSITRAVRSHVTALVRSRMKDVVPFVAVTVLPRSDSTRAVTPSR